MLSLSLTVIPVSASGVFIRADGSIEPVTANIISMDNVTYTFTDNNYVGIVVERDNIVVDGAGYTLQGMGLGTGIDLTGRSNVTIKNTDIKSFSFGILLYESSNYNNISGNNITNNIDGIRLWLSSNYNNISRNDISANNKHGMFIASSSTNNTVSGNNVTNNECGVYIYISSNNTLYHNNFI
jgi:parallel beta-helix repeat protein